MITSIYIDNFKSLVDFRLNSEHALTKFICLIGLNGAGKSTLLQAFDFIGHLVEGRSDDWLKRREWNKSELASRLQNKQQITFSLMFEFSHLGHLSWTGKYDISLERCTHEFIRIHNPIPEKHDNFLSCLSIDNGLVTVLDEEGSELKYPVKGLSYQGSVLSFLNADGLHPAIQAVKNSLNQLKALDTLTPQAMRGPAKDGEDIGHGGESLAAFLHNLAPLHKEELLQQLQQFYPQITALETRATQAGKELSVSETWEGAHGQKLETGARHMNDGMLRILGILAQTLPIFSGDSENKNLDAPHCLLFDEIENGINPELVSMLVSHLIQAPQQIVVTTHSPMILNYLPDEVAKESVILLYRDAAGATRSVRFFDLPSAQERLEFLGPGEVFVDVDLKIVSREATALLAQTAESQAD